MYDSTERRMSRRVAMRARVAVQLDGASRAARALDLSEGGLFLHTAADLALGTRVTLTLALAPPLAFEITGDAVREDPTRGGFGVKFVEVPVSAPEAIRRMVDAEGTRPPSASVDDGRSFAC